jgi:hypothetical protein
MNAKLRLLLQLINNHADVAYLTSQGLSFSQISALIGHAIEHRFLERDEKGFCLTQLAQEMLRDEATKAREGAQGRWISPDDRYVIPQVGFDEVYLPKKKDSYFS